ncbi:unnamed protein product, partial [Chrysoparadoxa australica]
ELALSGYPPEDLLLRQDFIEANEQKLRQIASAVHDITVIIGHPQTVDGKLYNAASALQNGKVVNTYHKQHLPNYSVFDEERYFEPANQTLIFELDGVKFGILVCEDIWKPEPAALCKQAGADVIITLNASPYHMDKLDMRYDVLIERAKEVARPIIYANLVGGQDELVFDGASFMVNQDGAITHQAPSFVESLTLIQLNQKHASETTLIKTLSQEAMVYEALKLGLTDYINKNG